MSVNYNPKIVTDSLVLCLDSSNTKSYSRNIHPQPLDLYTWYVGLRGNNTGNQVTVHQDFNTSRSPVGGIPMRMDIIGADPHIGSYSNPIWNLAEAKTGEKWIFSVYAKATATMRPQLFIFGDDDGSGFLQAPAGANADITTEWSRVYFATTFSNASINFIQARLDGPDSGQTGQSIWFDGWQLERIPAAQTLPSEFTAGNGRLPGNRIGNLSASGSFNLSNGLVYNDSQKSLLFDGVDDHILFEAGTLGSVITVEMLVKTNALGARMHFGFTSYNVYTAGNGMGFNTGAGDVYGLTAQQVTDLGIVGNWKHLTFVMQNSTSASNNPYTNNKIYVNGIEQPLSQVLTNLQSGNVRAFTSGSGIISGWLNNLTQHKASMDLASFKIYNKQLSDAEINQNFNAVRGRYGI
jgi:hypothetical protein